MRSSMTATATATVTMAALLAATMMLAAPSAATSLQTRATVVLVPASAVDLDRQDPATGPAWSLGGAPDEQVHVMWRWRTLDGALHEQPATTILRLDGAGRAVSAAAASQFLLASPAHAGATPLVITLVVCRE